MTKVFLAALAAAGATSLTLSVAAQTAPTATHRPSARNGLTEQLDHLSARIDHHLARGQISQHDAVKAHREINDLQAEASDDRLQNGGQLREADRFGLQARITQLQEEVGRDRTTGASAPPI
jgi:hypothetical protein